MPLQLILRNMKGFETSFFIQQWFIETKFIASSLNSDN